MTEGGARPRQGADHVVVREVQPGEEEAAGRLTLAVYAGLPGAHMTDDYADELVDVPRRAKEAVVLVAVGGGELAGAVTYVPDPSSPWAEQLREGEAGIRMLAVDPRFRGQGVGTALVDACVARARSACRDAMFLHSTPWMPAAHRIYLKAGFRRAPERDWFPRPDLPLLAFILALGAGNGNGMAAL